MIKVLVLSHYLVVPPLSGGAMRIVNPLLALGKRGGYEFTILFRTHAPGHLLQAADYFAQFPFVRKCIGVLDKNIDADTIKLQPFLELPLEVYNVIDGAFRDQLIEILQSEKFDIVQLEHSQMAWVAPYVRKYSPNSKLVLDLHNVEHVIYKRRVKNGGEDNDLKERYLREWMRMERWEREVFPWFDACLTVSPLETDTFRSFAPGVPTFEIPTGGGVPLERFPWREDWSEQKQHDIVYIGTMNWYPNAHGLVWFVEKVLPIIEKQRPGTKLSIVGFSTPEDVLVQAALRNPAVTLYGEQEDERDFFASCSAFIVPLFIAAGARVKIVTAWAAGAPVVSTSIGVEGLAAKDGENILISDDPAEYAQHVLTVMNSRETALKLRLNGRHLVEQQYSLTVATERLDKAYKEIAACAERLPSA